jgi:hypothetical protein
MAEVISLYAVVDAYRALKRHSLMRIARRAVFHQELELRDRESLKRTGVCILCGHKNPEHKQEREEEWR